MQVLIVDDHPVVISGCRSILSAEGDISVISAQDGATAYELCRTSRPDVVVIDINLPGMSGFDLIKQILQHDPSTRIIVFTMSYDPIFAARAIESGAKGYIGKGEDPARFVAAVRTVASGHKFVGPDMAQKLAFFDRSRGADHMSDLSPRELEILRLLHEGKSMVEIAAIISMSYKTVANCCATLKRKLGARTLLDLVRIAFENKIS